MRGHAHNDGKKRVQHLLSEIIQIPVSMLYYIVIWGKKLEWKLHTTCSKNHDDEIIKYINDIHNLDFCSHK